MRWRSWDILQQQHIWRSIPESGGDFWRAACNATDNWSTDAVQQCAGRHPAGILQTRNISPVHRHRSHAAESTISGTVCHYVNSLDFCRLSAQHRLSPTLRTAFNSTTDFCQTTAMLWKSRLSSNAGQHTGQGSLKVTGQIVLWMPCTLLFLQAHSRASSFCCAFSAAFRSLQPQANAHSAPSNTSSPTSVQPWQKTASMDWLICT